MLEANLADPVLPRWLAFTSAALAAGAAAVFGFPLQVGTVSIGALNLYRDRSGPLDDEAHANALVVAGVIGQALLVMQAEAPVGSLATELEASANLRRVVHQASGMVSVQLGITVAEAMSRLRARAFADDRHLGDVAEAVVGRRLRFEGDEVAP